MTPVCCLSLCVNTASSSVNASLFSDDVRAFGSTCAVFSWSTFSTIKLHVLSLWQQAQRNSLIFRIKKAATIFQAMIWNIFLPVVLQSQELWSFKLQEWTFYTMLLNQGNQKGDLGLYLPRKWVGKQSIRGSEMGMTCNKSPLGDVAVYGQYWPQGHHSTPVDELVENWQIS